MASRLQLDQELRELIGKSGHVYFQPPPSYKLKYDCIIYEQSNGKTDFAANMPYNFTKKYNLTLITRDPDTPLVRELAMRFPMIVMDRAYSADNLNHYVFTLYY